MGDAIRKSLFKVEFSDRRAPALVDKDELRALIQSGAVGEKDRVSIAGGAAKPWTALPAFADLVASRAASEGAARALDLSAAVAPTPTVPRAAPEPSPEPVATSPDEVAPTTPSDPGAQARTAQPLDAAVIELSGMELRQRLLGATPSDVLGVDLAAPRGEVARAFQLRRAQLEAHRDVSATSVAQRVGVADCVRLLTAAFELARDVRAVREYQTVSREVGRPVPLAEFVEFEKGLHDPGGFARAQTPVDAAPVPDETVAQPVLAVVRPARDETAAAIAAAAAAFDDAIDARTRDAAQLSHRLTKPGTRARRALDTAEHWLVPSTSGVRGTDRSGDLVYGVGDQRETLLAVVTLYAIAISVPLALTVATDLDVRESRFDVAGLMAWIRVGVLSLLTLVALPVIFGERLGRLGWAPHRARDLAPPAIIGVMAAVAAHLWLPLEIVGAPSAGALIGLLALRAIAEALFFDGVVTRRLLIGLPSAKSAMLLSVVMYAMYANSYRFMWDPTSEEPTSFGTPLYACLVALPAAFGAYRARTWWISALIRFVALGSAAVPLG